jgi:hypothetical protein
LSYPAYNTVVDQRVLPLRAWELYCNREREANTSPYLRCRAGRNEFLIPCVATHQRELLGLYQPDSWKGHALKSAVTAALQSSWRGWPLERVYLRIDPLLQLLQDRLSVSNVSLTFRLSTPTNCRKLIAQAISASGEVLAIVKLPLTPGAVSRIRNEATTLARLNALGTLEEGVPRLLHAGEFEGSFVLIQTVAPSCAIAGPKSFDRMHQMFLERLHEVSRSVCTGLQLLLLVAEDCAGSKEFQQFKGLFDLLGRDIRGTEVVCSLTHGDFAPWNTRAAQGALYVFDWESATDSRPSLWDEFHFRTQIAALLGRTSIDISHEQRSLYGLYLLDSLVMLEQEESPDANGLEYRRKALRCFLKEREA